MTMERIDAHPLAVFIPLEIILPVVLLPLFIALRGLARKFRENENER